MFSRRGLLSGFSALLAAPAIVRVSSLMPVSVQPLRPLYGASPAMAALEAIKQHREAMAKMFSELGELIVNPPFPTAIEVQEKRVELFRALAPLLQSRSRTMIGRTDPTPSGSPA